ncbi:MAG: ABC transporter [Candidatus Methanoperedens sp.]|nr:ABC transporter [Candidatus Methanoperedens sp.]
MNLLIISKWELRRTGLYFGKRILILSALILILIGLVSLFVSQNGLHINDNIYKIVVTDPAIAEVLMTDDKFNVYIAKNTEAIELFKYRDFDILITENNISYHSSERSIAALDALDKAIIRYDEARLLSYNDLNNTFPVWITVENIERQQVFQAPALQLPGFEKSQDNTDNSIPLEVTISEKPGKETASYSSIKEMTGTNKLSPVEDQVLSTPSHFNPPFPFKSVVLSFLFIFPIFFIAQLFSSSIMEERIRRKGELLLVSPLGSYKIVLGKLLPYLLISLVMMTGIIINIKGNALMLIIMLPVILMFLSTAFLGAIIARSYKELSFVLIFMSVLLSGYIFFPAMFVSIHAISIISPVTLIVMLLEGEQVSITDYLFSTMPFYLVSTLGFIFGIFIYREEDLFTQKTIRNKLVDSVHEFIKRTPAPLFFLSMALLPVAFSIQLMLIVLMFNLQIKTGVVIFIIFAALIEEVVKSAGIYTIFSRKLSDASIRNALKFGILSGTGFFVGEKLLLLIVVSSIAGSVFGSAMGIGLLVFPLLLHITSTTAASLSLRSRNYLFSIILATTIHSAYNLYLVRSVIFG